MNIKGQELENLVNKYIDREWQYIKTIDFPKTREHPIQEKNIINEWNRLKVNTPNWKTRSSIVLYFHPSINYFNKGGLYSSYEYWQELKKDKELFKKFLANRYSRSDWYNEKPENWNWLMEGKCPQFIYGIGLTTSGKAPRVSYFKPAQMKYLVENYAQDYPTIFDPFAGFCSRMVGTLACNKKYIGYDISDILIEENSNCGKWIKSINPEVNYELYNKDSLKSKGVFKNTCLITCPPYSNAQGKQIEEWRMKDGSKITCEKTCDEIINYCLENYTCDKYIFVVDNSAQKYKDYIVNSFTNTNYMNARNGKLTKSSYNNENIVVVERTKK